MSLDSSELYVGQEHRFRLTGPLGQGGMADTYEGECVDHCDLRAAVKVPRLDLDQEELELFLEEVAAAKKVEGEGIVSVVDWGTEPVFIASELVTADTLSHEIAQLKALGKYWSDDELTARFVALAKAARQMTDSGIVHRDLSPSNIFIDGASIKIGDFGLAKFAEHATRTKTFRGEGHPFTSHPKAFRDRPLTGGQTNTP